MSTSLLAIRMTSATVISTDGAISHASLEVHSWPRLLDRASDETLHEVALEREEDGQRDDQRRVRPRATSRAAAAITLAQAASPCCASARRRRMGSAHKSQTPGPSPGGTANSYERISRITSVASTHSPPRRTRRQIEQTANAALCLFISDSLHLDCATRFTEVFCARRESSIARLAARYRATFACRGSSERARTAAMKRRTAVECGGGSERLAVI